MVEPRSQKLAIGYRHILFLAVLGRPLQMRHNLDMMRLREHVEGRDRDQRVA